MEDFQSEKHILYYITLKNTQMEKEHIDKDRMENEVLYFQALGNVSIQKKPLLPAQDVIDFFCHNANQQTWRENVEELTKWNRFSKGKEIHLAKDFLVTKFKTLTQNFERKSYHRFNGQEYGYDAELMDVTVENVSAKLIGSQFPDKFFLVGAHYDSISEIPMEKAPGAIDNASGSAAVLELARLWKLQGCRYSLYFVLFTGEEQGFRGSQRWVNHILAHENLSEGFQGSVIIDMLTYSPPTAQHWDVLLETADWCQEMLTPWEEVKHLFPIRYIRSLHPFESDHMPFLDVNMPSVLITNLEGQNYIHYSSFYGFASRM